MFTLCCSLVPVLPVRASGPNPADLLAAAALDQIWVDHLLARADQVHAQPILREAFLRDALRLRPDAVPALDGLLEVWTESAQPAMAAMARLYRDRLTGAEGQPAGRAAVVGAALDLAGAPEAREMEALRRDLAAAEEHLAAKNYLQAELDLRSVLRRHPLQPEALSSLRELYRFTGDRVMGTMVLGYAEAAVVWARAEAERAPANTEAGLVLAGTLLAAGDLAEADRCLTRLESSYSSRDLTALRALWHAMRAGREATP